MKVRIYSPAESRQPPRQIATVVLSDRQDQASWLPAQVAAGARFFLAQVDTDSPDVERRIRGVLQQPSVRVARASSHRRGAVRTRGDYSADEPYGTLAYWRAAFGRLRSDTGLTFDLQDYGQMLAEMEAGPIAHPIRLLQPSLEVPPAVRHEMGQTNPDLQITPNRLASALQWLASTRQDLMQRLLAWRQQVERGTVQAEVAVRAVLSAGLAGTVQILAGMSHPSLQAAYSGADTRRKPLATGGEDQAQNAIVITTDAVAGAKVTVEANTILVTFLNWEASSPPLAVLVPDDESIPPRAPDVTEGEGGEWILRFKHVLVGTYLLVVAPVRD